MKEFYNYIKNINVDTTANGDKVITMNEAIFTTIRNAIYDSAEYQEEKGYDATSDERMDLWSALVYKNNISKK